MCQFVICLQRWTWAGDLGLSELDYVVWLIPESLYFFFFSLSLTRCHTFMCILGAWRRSRQPPAGPGCTKSHRGADNWAVVIPWWISTRRKATNPGSALEGGQPASPRPTTQVIYCKKKKEDTMFIYCHSFNAAHKDWDFHSSFSNEIKKLKNCKNI